MRAEGTYAEFKKYVGTAYFGNLIQKRTKNHPNKRACECQGLNDDPPHIVTGKGVIKFCHIPWRDRLDILKQVLFSYKIGPEPVTDDTIYHVDDLAVLIDQFWKAHLPLHLSGAFLCPEHDHQYEQAILSYNGR
jgi:hypothetical protein